MGLHLLLVLFAVQVRELTLIALTARDRHAGSRQAGRAGKAGFTQQTPRCGCACPVLPQAVAGVSHILWLIVNSYYVWRVENSLMAVAAPQ